MLLQGLQAHAFEGRHLGDEGGIAVHGRGSRSLDGRFDLDGISRIIDDDLDGDGLDLGGLFGLVGEVDDRFGFVNGLDRFIVGGHGGLFGLVGEVDANDLGGGLDRFIGGLDGRFGIGRFGGDHLGGIFRIVGGGDGGLFGLSCHSKKGEYIFLR
ncbi:MAG: hypothetical protein ACOX5G_12120 [Kiritimatiellia bacterium]